jgi:SAM-dependent methyltransferase
VSTTAGAYDGAAEAWAAGPAQVYARLGEAMLDDSPVPLANAAVLDVGAGTAVVAEAARRRGARRVVASDIAARMLGLRAAGFPAVRVGERSVGADLDSPDDVVRWRFGMAHLAPWVAGLPEQRRQEATAAARDAVAELGPVSIDILVGAGR